MDFLIAFGLHVVFGIGVAVATVLASGGSLPPAAAPAPSVQIEQLEALVPPPAPTEREAQQAG